MVFEVRRTSLCQVIIQPNYYYLFETKLLVTRGASDFEPDALSLLPVYDSFLFLDSCLHHLPFLFN